MTYGWALTDPASGVTVTFDDAASAMPVVTIPALATGTELTFTLTVTGRGGTDGIVPCHRHRHRDGGRLRRREAERAHGQ